MDCEQYAKLGCKISELHILAPPNAARFAVPPGADVPLVPLPAATGPSVGWGGLGRVKDKWPTPPRSTLVATAKLVYSLINKHAWYSNRFAIDYSERKLAVWSRVGHEQRYLQYVGLSLYRAELPSAGAISTPRRYLSTRSTQSSYASVRDAASSSETVKSSDALAPHLWPWAPAGFFPEVSKLGVWGRK